MVEVGIVGGPLLTLLGALTTFTARILGSMPLPARAEDEYCGGRGCRLPMLVPQYSNRTSYRCSDCGRRWKIQVDMRLPRNAYRRWIPAQRWRDGEDSSSVPDQIELVGRDGGVLLVRMGGEALLPVAGERDGGRVQQAPGHTAKDTTEETAEAEEARAAADERGERAEGAAMVEEEEHDLTVSASNTDIVHLECTCGWSMGRPNGGEMFGEYAPWSVREIVGLANSHLTAATS